MRAGYSLRPGQPGRKSGPLRDDYAASVEEDAPTAVGSLPEQSLVVRASTFGGTGTRSYPYVETHEDLYRDDLYGSVTTGQVLLAAPPQFWPGATGEIPLTDPSVEVVLTQARFLIPAQPRSSRAALLFAAACIVTMGGGFGLGWAFFSGQGNELVGRLPGEAPAAPAVAAAPLVTEPAAAPAPVPAAAPVAASVTTAPADPRMASPVAPAMASPAAPSGPVALKISSWALNPGNAVASPVRGEIDEAYLAKARRVRKGEKLFRLKRKRPPTARGKQLAVRVAELEKLAAADPVYGDFLARARRDLRKEQKSVRVTVTARSAGWVQPEVRRGQRVDQGDALATAVDPRVRMGTVTLPGGAVHLDWSCGAVSAGLRDSVSCRIAQVTDTEKGQVVSLQVDADRNHWSRGLAGEEFVLAPPAATAGP
jgi:biotin carboxyl carrier protein